MSSDDPNDRTEVRSDDELRPVTKSARFAPGEMLASRYRIIAPLGRGGMGEVYRAEDTRLGQELALKFLPQSARVDPRMLERLVDEVRIGRQISHPNVCRLYDLVESGELSFIAMEFVEGEDLSSLLRRIGRLPGDKAIALTHDLAAGLAAAHDVGVIHRDLKPANVMIDHRGQAKITDFGLALLRVDTVRHEVGGTPAYMAPEQFTGSPAGIRTDLYALGLVLFEMFTGRRLFDGDISEISRLHKAPKPALSDIVYDIDPAIERLILSCVDESPEERPSSAHQILAELPTATRPSAPSVRSSSRPTPSSGPGEGKSIAVLPFEDLDPSKGDDYFSIGLAEEIISDLAKIESLRVISRGSVMRFKGSRDLPAVARELHVAYVLTGSVRKASGQLRVTANLVNGATDTIVWSEKFRGTMDDIFDIQETVARTVAERLKGKLTEEEKERIAERPIPNALAYEFYLKARLEILKFSDEGLKNALSLLDRGLEIVGDNALIYAAMAFAYWQYFNAGLSADEANLRKAEDLARKIFALEPGSHHGRRILGLVAGSRGDALTGIVELQKAWHADPTDTDSLFWSSTFAVMVGEIDLARRGTKKLTEIDPFGPYALMAQVFVAWIDGDFGAMQQLASTAERLDPENRSYAVMNAYGILLAGRRDEAIGRFRHASEHYPHNFFSVLGMFLAHASLGERAEAMRLFDEISAPARNDLQYSLLVAEGFAILGDTDSALDWLENAIGRGFLAHEYFAGRDPLLASLRGDAQFEKLVARAIKERAKIHSAVAQL